MTGPRETNSRNAADTRRRILEAATTEFSAAGLAGARTARIAAAVPVNQRMIYAYFGNKDGLFDAVLEHHVLRAQSAVTLDPADLPGYAQQVFDVYRRDPHLVRLYLWLFLERPEMVTTVVPAAAAMKDKVAALRRAQEAGVLTSALPAEKLLDYVLALTLGNLTGHPNAWTDEERRALGLAVRRLTSP